MRARIFKLYYILIPLILSCSDDRGLYSQIEELKQIGDAHPDSALDLLHNLDEQIEVADKHTQNTCKMLSIRLCDKAYIKATSDKNVKEVLEYFENNGNWNEKQEANYYAGSVYRDLDDVPRALTMFLRSIDCAEQGSQIDSILLRNTYSQLYALYFSVQDYSNALIMARKESDVAEKLHILDTSTLLHEGAALLRLDSTTAAKNNILHAFQHAERSDGRTDIYSLSSLLYQLSSLGYIEESHTCYEHIKEIQKDINLPASTYLALGKYFRECEQTDSAICCYKKVLHITKELDYIYDALRNLSLIYDSKNDYEKANYYAQTFIQINDSLNLEKRQTDAASTHNKYKYLKNKEEEQKIKEEKDLYHRILLIAIFIFCIVVLMFITLYMYKKNTHLQEIVSKTNELDRIKTVNHELQNEISKQELQLVSAREKLGNNELEMEQMKAELTKSDNELHIVRLQLEERLMQSKSIFQLLRQTQFESNTDDIITKLRKAADGLYKMTELDWKNFHNAVNELYPYFADEMVTHLGKKINDKQLLFCELMRVGITNPQIQVLMDMPKATVWRWAKRYDWIIDPEHKNVI